eukprot:TRINITY_DN32935_c0_g1_i2.p1 TRINITY_DN32935_c0_g1~~TRINITY_DN32935_c0_g1_i2.p1  ORF type:complete len:395 (+),score=74.90 TRINITY_DN32935_c0_g1_i2:56-1186(+)
MGPHRAAQRGLTSAVASAAAGATLLQITPAAALGSAGCGAEPPVPPGGQGNFLLGTASAAFPDAAYLLRVPPTYHPDTPNAVILLFHGWQQEGNLPYTGEWDTGGYVVVAPNGPDDGPSGARSWNAAGSAASPGPLGATCDAAAASHLCYDSCKPCADKCWWSTCQDTVSLALYVVAAVQRLLCVDRRRVHAVGNSAGGMQVLELAADPRAAGVFASFVTDHGLPHAGFNRPPVQQPASLLGIWGDDDKTMPPHGDHGGELTRSYDGYLYNSALNLTALWAHEAHCARPLRWLPLPPPISGMRCSTAAGCGNAASIVACFDEGGHNRFWGPSGECNDENCPQPHYARVIFPFLGNKTLLGPPADWGEGAYEQAAEL